MPSGDSVSTYQITGPFRPAPVVASPLELDAALWAALERQRAADLAAAAAPANGKWWDLPRYDRPATDPYVLEWLERSYKAHTRSCAEWVPGHEARMHARQQLASYLERVVLPARADPKLHQLPADLVHARRSGTTAYNPELDRYIRFYDAKAEKPLLCPDDSREEGSRLYRRYGPQIDEWMDPGSGHQVHYIVLTCPHARAGLLARRMRGLVARARKVLGEFKCITGSLIVLEAPLSAARKWNVHLNVIVTTDGSFLDYERLRHRWRWQLEAQRLAGGKEELRRSFGELLKYAVQTVATKSVEKLAAHQTQAPAMTEWTAAEWLEWWDAHKRFRRTRSYGCLYKIGKPVPQSMVGFVHVGWFATYRGRLFFRSALLDSIQGHNSAPPIPPLTLEELAKCRGPPPTGPPSQQQVLL